MKKIIVGGLAAGAVALGIAAAAPANADIGFDPGSSMYGGGSMGDHDKYAYWNMMDQYGKNLTPETAEYFATQACRALNAGASEGQVVHIAEQSGMPGYIARLAVRGAEYHYCPSYF
jgi:hypothetical protein